MDQDSPEAEGARNSPAIRNGKARPARRPALCLAAVYLLLLAVAAAWMALRDGGLAAVGETLIGHDLLESLAAGGFLGGVVTIVLHASPLAQTRAVRRMRRFFRTLIPDLRPSEAWILALTSGIAEEALFRGALQPTVGLWAASAVFGLMHFPPSRRLVAWPILAAVLGLAFGAIYHSTGNLLGPMAAHVIINLVGLRRLCPRR